MISTRGYLAKLPANLILVWVIFVIIVYLFIVQQTRENPKTEITSKVHSRTIDAIVYIAMGKLAVDPLIDYAIASVRKVGHWNGKIFVLTDHYECFNDTANTYDIRVLSVPPAKDLIHIKAMKTKLFDYLPNNINKMLYLDVDIVARQSFESFYNDLTFLMDNHDLLTKANATINPSTTNFDFAAFPDSKGHFVGFCSGCEKWHTGVIYLKRSQGKECMTGWGKILLSGKFDTDQQSLDEAEKLGYCKHGITLPPKHLLFAKDYIGMALSSGQTFIHFTAVSKIETQDYFYRSLIVPNLRRSLNPPLNPKILNKEKLCVVVRDNQNNNSTIFQVK